MKDANTRTRVVIVGGGFAGLNAAKLLGAKGPSSIEVTLVDRRNHHLFQPLLYQVATAGLNPADISTPIRTVLKGYDNVSVRLGDVQRVDLEHQVLHTSSGPLEYDYCIMACGASHAYFGHDEWEDHAPGLKTLEQATEIRRRVLTAYEKAELESDPVRRRQLLTFVVVGGGPTGVELAGAIGELSRYTLTTDFRQIDPSTTRVLLIEGGPRILSAFKEDLSRDAMRSLETLGVTVWTNSIVTEVSERGVQVGDEFVASETVLWAAGVNASPLGNQLHTPLDKAGRVKVGPDLSLPGQPEFFVVGDQAHVLSDAGEEVPGVAPAAIQMGRLAASNILADLRGLNREEFSYFDKGLMATIGRASAVVQSGKLHMSGFIAWIAWCFVHIFYLIGFRNRALVFFQWVWSYVRYRRGARLITARDWRLVDDDVSADDPAPVAVLDKPAPRRALP